MDKISGMQSRNVRHNRGTCVRTLCPKEFILTQLQIHITFAPLLNVTVSVDWTSLNRDEGALLHTAVAQAVARRGSQTFCIGR